MSHSTKITNKRCKTCSQTIENKSVTYHCIACGEFMHLTPKCTGLPTEAIFGISSIIHNVLLFCQKCTDLKKKDEVTEIICSSREIAKTNELHQSIKTLKNEIEERSSNENIVIKELHETVKILKNQVDEIKNSQNVNNVFLNQQLQDLKGNITKAPPPQEPKYTQQKIPNQKRQTNDALDGIRVRGIPELVSNDSRMRYDHDFEEVCAMISHLEVDCNIKDLKRIGKYTEGKNRTLIVNVDSKHAKRLILLSLRKLKTYTKSIYVSKELNPNEQILENNLLLKRRELIIAGTDPKKLRVRNLTLQKEENKKWINIDLETPNNE